MTTEANGELPEQTDEGFQPADHRAFVREINRSLALAYGFGGGGVLIGVVGMVIGAWMFGWIWSPITWLVVVTGALIGLAVVRMVVYRRVNMLYERLESYCEANDVEPGALRAHFDDEHLFPYFQALFELRERRKRLRAGASDSQAD